MKILITGSTGLVGRNLSEKISSSYELLLPKHSELDLTDYNAVYSYFSENKPDFIIHCAGKVGGIQANIQEPVSFFVNNLDMGRNVVLASWRLGIKKLINLGSSCIYPRNYINPLKEEYLLKGELEPTNEGYALAKISTIKLCEYISKEDSSCQYKTLIPCNLYGSYDNFHPLKSHMIPAVIRKIDEAVTHNESVVEIWGDGEARREFMHIDDLVMAIEFVISNYENIPNVMNVGTGRDFSINEYYSAVADVIGYSGRFSHDLSKPVGMARKVVDVSLASGCGWESNISLAEGLKETYLYYLREVKEKQYDRL
ncbi:MAG: GDP-L-fucose synthase [Spirochaetales bacterium]|nr:GDP-L-fucose synthase [Spirochaetales bacterium]